MRNFLELLVQGVQSTLHGVKVADYPESFTPYFEAALTIAGNMGADAAIGVLPDGSISDDDPYNLCKLMGLTDLIILLDEDLKRLSGHTQLAITFDHLQQLSAGFYLRFCKGTKAAVHVYCIEVTEDKTILIHENIPRDQFHKHFDARMQQVLLELNAKQCVAGRSLLSVGGGFQLVAALCEKFLEKKTVGRNTPPIRGAVVVPISYDYPASAVFNRVESPALTQDKKTGRSCKKKDRLDERLLTGSGDGEVVTQVSTGFHGESQLSSAGSRTSCLSNNGSTLYGATRLVSQIDEQTESESKPWWRRCFCC